MATAAGGSPPAGNNGNSTSNGNTSVTGLNALLDSVSDVNLGLLQISNNFISAKNSVELHKSRGRRFFPNHSLPSVLTSEPMESGSGSSQEDNEETSVSNSRTMNWADLHSSHGHQILANHPHHHNAHHVSFRFNSSVAMDSSIEAAAAAVREASLPSKQAAAEPKTNEATQTGVETEPEISVLHAPNETKDFAPDKSRMDMEMLEAVLTDAHVSAKRLREDSDDEESEEFWNQQKALALTEHLDPLLPTVHSGFPMMIPNAQTPDEGSVLEVLGDQIMPASLINAHDGLGLLAKKGEIESPKSVHFTPTSQNPFNSERIGSLPFNQFKQDPVSVYYEESFGVTPLQPAGDHEESLVPIPHPPAEVKYSSYSYDADDDLDFDKKPELVLKSANDLPVPDPAYVAANVPDEFVPLIAKIYKKDCRTWLWKSKTQRENRLKQQAEDEANGIVREMPRQPSSVFTSDQSQPLEFCPEDEDLEKRMKALEFSSYYS